MSKAETFTKKQFDRKLREMLEQAKREGKTSIEIVSRDLHQKVVGGLHPNRMPMACEAMWDLWGWQGSIEDNIIHTTRSGMSSTIEMRFLTE